MRGRSAVLAAVALAGSLVPLRAAAGPRHQAGGQDPTGSAAVQAWAELDGGELRHGQTSRLGPPASSGTGPGGSRLPDPGPFFGALIPEVPDDPYVPEVEGPDTGAGRHLPDLVALPAWNVYMDESYVGSGAGDFVLDAVQGRDPAAGTRRAIRFATTIANRGRHSLEVVGVARPDTSAGGFAKVDASQCVRFAGPRVAGAARVCQEYVPVGSLVFHAQHGHLHIDGFAQYRLLKDRGGKPDTSPSGVLARSEKVGFCMGDTTWLGQGDLVVDSGWYRECRHTTPHVPATFRQGVSPSWGDTYGADLPGQFLLADKLADGIYWIAITVNPGGPGAVRLHETSGANNTSYRKIRVFERGASAVAVP